MNIVKKKLFIICFIEAISMSLLCAWLAYVHLDERIPIVGSFIGLQKSFNDGIAFGISLGAFQTVFILCALVLIGNIGIKSEKLYEQIGFGLILGGGVANVVDRFHDGYVTDMIQIGIFPIFNVADAYINIGVAFVLIGSLLSSLKSKMA